MTSSLSSHIHHAAADDDEEEEASLFPDPLHSSDDNPPETPSPAYHHHRLPSLDATVTVRLLPSQGLSFQLWPSSLSLLSSLSSPLSSLLPFPSPRRPLRILELGSGAGLVGISYAAALRAHVTVTDLPHVLPNLLHNVDLNSSVLRERGGEVSVAQLRWGEVEDVEKVGREFDLVLATDVVYYDYLYEPLLKTLRWLFEGKGRDEMVFVMGHVRRWKKDNLFFRKARKWFDVEVLWTDRESHPGSRSGVIVYRFGSKAPHPSTALSSDVNAVPESVHTKTDFHAAAIPSGRSMTVSWPNSLGVALLWDYGKQQELWQTESRLNKVWSNTRFKGFKMGDTKEIKRDLRFSS